MDASSSDFTQRLKPLEHFRAKTRRLKIHPVEKAALWAICLHLIFLPWAIGTMRPWAQGISFALAIIGFVVALIPREYTAEQTGAAEFRLVPLPRLLKFPIFWLGLALLAVIVIQALNPAWNYTTDGKTWWMTSIPHRKWLPAGVIAPFEKWNQWRMLMIYSSAWLTVCAIWVAFTRRRTVQLLLTTLAVNGLLLAIFGVVQRMFGNGKIYWFYTSQNPAFFSTFVYKNHGAAYLDLALAVTCGLAGWYHLRGLRRMEKSNPSGVLAFFATCIAVSILISYARGATIVMLGFLLICIGAFVVHQLRLPKESRKPLIAIVLVAIFGVFLKTGLDALQSGKAWERLRRGIMREDLSLEAREQVTRASIEMLQEQWKRGVGAGSFRFIFPVYQHRHPELLGKGNRHLFWHHAHNDVVQFPIELGIAGMVVLALGFGYWFVTLARSYFWEKPLSACIVVGLALLILYSWWDFPFQCPAILITWCALWPAATLWARFEESGPKT